jgi:orotate phosphoribosyltransferase
MPPHPTSSLRSEVDLSPQAGRGKRRFALPTGVFAARISPRTALRYTAAMREQLKALIRERSFGRGKITLASGRESDFYFDLRPTTIHPAGASFVGELVLDALDGVEADTLGGLEMGAVPIATAAAIAAHRRGRALGTFFVRKQPKDHGARKLVEGLPKGETLSGRKVVIVEDVTTTGGSSVKAIRAVRDEGAEVVLVLAIVDRQEGATETFAAEGVPFRALFTADEFLRE